MRCDECKFWEREINTTGICSKICDHVEIRYDEDSYVYYDESETIEDFFCAAFEGKDDE
jgi:hypothetical protein